jgi:uncharacterized protein (TIGR00369 family)
MVARETPGAPPAPGGTYSPSDSSWGTLVGWREVEVEGADLALEMDVTPKVVNGSGAIQGGVLATLIDVVAGLSLTRGEHAYMRIGTSEMQISFLDGARIGPARAVAHILRRGGRNAVVRVDVHDLGADNLFVATATLTFSVKLRPDATRA